MKPLLFIVFLGGSALAQMTPAGGSWVRDERIGKIDDMTHVTYRVLAAPSRGRGVSKFTILCPGGELAGVMYSPDAKLTVDHVYGNIVLNDVEYRIDRNPYQSGEWARPDSGDDLFWLHAPLTEVLDGHTLLIRLKTLDGGLIEDEFPVAGLNRKMFRADCRP
jgi:hypothetical protein